MNAVQLAAYDRALLLLLKAMRCETVDAISQLARRFGGNPSLEDLQLAYARVKAGGVL